MSLRLYDNPKESFKPQSHEDFLLSLYKTYVITGYIRRQHTSLSMPKDICLIIYEMVSISIFLPILPLIQLPQPQYNNKNRTTTYCNNKQPKQIHKISQAFRKKSDSNILDIIYIWKFDYEAQSLSTSNSQQCITERSI
eukprot:7400_1